MLDYGVIGEIRGIMQIDEVDERIKVNEVLPKIKPAKLRHIGCKKGKVNLLFTGLGKSLQAVGKGQNLRFRLQSRNDGRSFFKACRLIVHNQNGHEPPPARITRTS